MEYLQKVEAFHFILYSILAQKRTKIVVVMGSMFREYIYSKNTQTQTRVHILHSTSSNLTQATSVQNQSWTEQKMGNLDVVEEGCVYGKEKKKNMRGSQE